MTSNKTPINKFDYTISDNILESITDGLFTIDKEWTVTYWNNEAERLLKMPREKILGKNLREIYRNAVPLKLYTEYHRAMAHNVSVRFDEYFPTLNSWLEMSVYPSETGLSVYFINITSRKNATHELREAKERYRELFDQSPIPMWVYDLETLQFLDVNKAAIRNYGYTLAEFLSMTIKDIRPKEDIVRLQKLICTKIRSGGFNKSTARHLKKNGELIYVNTEGNTFDLDGRQTRLVLAIDDTERIMANQALKLSENRFKRLIQDGGDLIAILDKAGNYKYVSPTSFAVVFIKAKEFIGKNAFDFIHPDDKSKSIEEFSQLANHKYVKLTPFRFRDGHDNYRWIETILTDMSENPAVGGIVSNSRDVTSRIENEASTRESNERYNTVSKATSDTIYDWDFSNGQIKWNRGLKGIFGYDQMDFSTQDWRTNKIHPDDAGLITDTIQVHIREKKSRWKGEYRFKCADGSYKHVLDRGFLNYDTAGNPMGMIGSLQDISERINYIHEIEEHNRKLQEISWMQSHVVRAPLARILGLINILSEDNEQQINKEALAFLAESAGELDDVIKNIISKSCENNISE
ncbi:MAG: PAS domain S-box protein [Bacteroidota bacterium]